MKPYKSCVPLGAPSEGVVVPERESSQHEKHAVRITRGYGLHRVPSLVKDKLES